VTHCQLARSGCYAAIRIPVILLAALLLSSCVEDDAIVLSVAVRSNPVGPSEPVTLVVTLRNRSSKPRYVHPNVSRQLDFAVRASDGTLLRGFMHPPGLPPMPGSPRDWVLVEGKRSVRCVMDVPLTDLGIDGRGTFSLAAFWYGVSSKSSRAGSEDATFNFEYAETTYLTVVNEKLRDGAPSPSADAYDGREPSCSAAAAERRPPS
jgi:hypothetical protein